MALLLASLVWIFWASVEPDSGRLQATLANGQFRAQYRRTRREVFPILSRIQNIGYELGENNRTPPWYRANHRTPSVATHVETDLFDF